MSQWSYILGTIEVDVSGRTQHECDYIIRTVLDHLPIVSGSERDMQVFVNQQESYGSCSWTDEWDQESNLLKNGRMYVQDRYLITVKGDLRDRSRKQTIREFQRWLNRLAKRLMVHDVLVKIYDTWCEDEYVITDKNNTYLEMYGVGGYWTDYLMWKWNKDEEGYNVYGVKPQ